MVDVVEQLDDEPAYEAAVTGERTAAEWIAFAAELER